MVVSEELQTKSTFGVHYRTGSPGQLGLRVAGFPGHWVAASQNVSNVDLCCRQTLAMGKRFASLYRCLAFARFWKVKL